MAEFKVSIDVSRAALMISSIDDGVKNLKTLHTWMGIQTQGWIYRNWPTGPPLSDITVGSRRQNTTNVLQDTGRLRLSITGKNPAEGLSKEEGSLAEATNSYGVIGSNLIYAKIQNDGGMIHAARAKNLAIPLTYRAKRAGSPRNFDGPLVFIPSKRNGTTGILVEKGKGSQFILHYMLTREITRNGKTVKSSGKSFCIPISSKAKKAKGGPRSLGEELTLIKSKKKPGVAYLVELKGNATRRKAHYLLKPSVFIPARPFIPTPSQLEPDLVLVADYYMQTLLDGNKPPSTPTGG